MRLTMSVLVCAALVGAASQAAAFSIEVVEFARNAAPGDDLTWGLVETPDLFDDDGTRREKLSSLEVLVAGLTDNTRLTRTKAVRLMCGAAFLIAIPPSINNAIFIPWDLTFGSGMQTLGAFLAVITVGWCISRSTALAQLALEGDATAPLWLFYWIRYGIPTAILAVGIWWFLTSVLGRLASV